MMKKILYIILSSLLSINAIAQDSLFIESDSILAISDSTLNYQIDSTIDFQLNAQYITPLPLDTILHDYFIEKAFQINCERTDSGAS